MKRSSKLLLLCLVGSLGASASLLAWTESKNWLKIEPVVGPKAEGSWIVSFQRRTCRMDPLPGGGQSFTPAVGSTMRIDPKVGKAWAWFDRVVTAFRVSRDGQRVAYRDDLCKLWIARLDGSGEPTLVPGMTGLPVWAPGDSAIVGTNHNYWLGPALDNPSMKGTWRVEIPGLHVSRFPIPDTDVLVDWSRDGRWLITLSSRDSTPATKSWDVYRRSPDGSDELRLTDSGMIRNPRLSPDGLTVVYASWDETGEALWVVKIDGTGRRKILVNLRLHVEAVWSPDSTYLLVKSGRDLVVIDEVGKVQWPVNLRWSPKRPIFALPASMMGPIPDERDISTIEWLAP